MRKVRRLFLHSLYRRSLFRYDIAIIELDAPITFSYDVRPICLPEHNSSYVDRLATVAGWGKNKHCEYI